LCVWSLAAVLRGCPRERQHPEQRTVQLHRPPPPLATACAPELADDLFDQGADYLARCAAVRTRQVRIE
jgi:hypothetical protein